VCSSRPPSPHLQQRAPLAQLRGRRGLVFCEQAPLESLLLQLRIHLLMLAVEHKGGGRVPRHQRPQLPPAAGSHSGESIREQQQSGGEPPGEGWQRSDGSWQRFLLNIGVSTHNRAPHSHLSTSSTIAMNCRIAFWFAAASLAARAAAAATAAPEPSSPAAATAAAAPPSATPGTATAGAAAALAPCLRRHRRRRTVSPNLALARPPGRLYSRCLHEGQAAMEVRVTSQHVGEGHVRGGGSGQVVPASREARLRTCQPAFRPASHPLEHSGILPAVCIRGAVHYGLPGSEVVWRAAGKHDWGARPIAVVWPIQQ
jgi:hypothetical protein